MLVHTVTQGWKESKDLLSKLKEYVVLGGAEHIQVRADAMLREPRKLGQEGWELGKRSRACRSGGQALEPAVWGLPSSLPGGRLTFLGHVPSCAFPASKSPLSSGRNRLHWKRCELIPSRGWRVHGLQGKSESPAQKGSL